MHSQEGSSQPTRRQIVSLQAMRDHLRPLLVFGAAGDRSVADQYALLAPYARELQERQLRLVLASASQPHAGSAPVFRFSREEEVAARQQYRIETNQFVVVLIGKDGGEKLRSETPLSFEQLRQTIDAMPMRQDEMKKR